MGKYDHLSKEMIRRYKGGEMYSHIGEQMGIPHTTVRRYLKMAGVLIETNRQSGSEKKETYITAAEIRRLRQTLKEGDKVPVIVSVNNPDAPNAHPTQKIAMRYVVRLPAKGEVILMSATQGVGKIEHYTYRDILVAMRRRQEG